MSCDELSFPPAVSCCGTPARVIAVIIMGHVEGISAIMGAESLDWMLQLMPELFLDS